MSKTTMAPKRNLRNKADVSTEVDDSVITEGDEPVVGESCLQLGTSDNTIEKLTGVFKLLADKSRLKIVLALAQEGQMHVTALCKLLKQSQPAVSHHLTLMRMVGLIKFDRNGKHNDYYLNAAFLRDLIEQFFADAGNDGQVLDLAEFTLTYSRQGED